MGKILDSLPERVERNEFLKEFNRKVCVMQFLGEIAETKRDPTQATQYREARQYVFDNFEYGFYCATERLFGEIEFDFADDDGGQFKWLGSLIMDPKLKPPMFPQQFTPESVSSVITHVYASMTTIAATLEEIEPAWRKWSDYEARTKLLYKAICGFDKEWQAEALFQTVLDEKVYVKIRRLSEYVQAFKIRLDSLQRAYDAVSRIITILEMNPMEPLTRREPEARPQSTTFAGKRGFQRTPK